MMNFEIHIRRNEKTEQDARIDFESFRASYNQSTDKLIFSCDIYRRSTPERIPVSEPEVKISVFGANDNYYGQAITEHDSLFWDSSHLSLNGELEGFRKRVESYSVCRHLIPFVMQNQTIHIYPNVEFYPTEKYLNRRRREVMYNSEMYQNGGYGGGYNGAYFDPYAAADNGIYTLKRPQVFCKHERACVNAEFCNQGTNCFGLTRR